ncbi:hypothetical protein [Bradyrhizobium australafricanum]|uniref:hypothetical protein n=1 Tax=Bradyrhizobium australafricanum TaxID=2821406 RepID=UPI001CE2FA29|nr:hypothetical protein [Bradyrhizobium australafricanum]MCA6103647.1 hypothetical protein [Bradyrhizobium australafricanum]
MVDVHGGDNLVRQKALSKPDDVKPVNQQKDLRFHLVTAADCAAFGKAMKTDLANVEFSDPADEEPQPDQA